VRVAGVAGEDVGEDGFELHRHAERFQLAVAALGVPMQFEAVLADILARDARDSHRATAPLRQAEDAVLLDTGGLSVEEAIARAIEAVER
jgi:cytidylate kinase